MTVRAHPSFHRLPYRYPHPEKPRLTVVLLEHCCYPRACLSCDTGRADAFLCLCTFLELTSPSQHPFNLSSLYPFIPSYFPLHERRYWVRGPINRVHPADTKRITFAPQESTMLVPTSSPLPLSIALSFSTCCYLILPKHCSDHLPYTMCLLLPSPLPSILAALATAMREQ